MIYYANGVLKRLKLNRQIQTKNVKFIGLYDAKFLDVKLTLMTFR